MTQSRLNVIYEEYQRIQEVTDRVWLLVVLCSLLIGAGGFIWYLVACAGSCHVRIMITLAFVCILIVLAGEFLALRYGERIAWWWVIGRKLANPPQRPE